MIAKVRPGDPLRIPASAYNAFVDAAEAYQAQQRQQQVDARGVVLPPGVALVRNQTGADLDRFAVVGLDAPLIGPDENLAAFHEHLTFAGMMPDADAHANHFGILQEPIAAGAIGRVLVSGVTPVQLDIQAADDELAAVVSGTTASLHTGSDGGARILWKADGTGVQWGLVCIPAGGSGGGSPNLVLAVRQANHGWQLGDVLHWTGSGWVLADAAVVGPTETLGVVGKIPDADSALIVLWGILCLDGLQDHTDYWLDPSLPGGLTPTKPDTAARLVLHHAASRLCVVRAGGAGDGSGGGAERFADLTDVDVTSTPPADGQVPAWDATAQRWKPTDGTLGPQPGTSVLANATGSSAKPTALAADTDGTALLRIGGTLQWAQVPTQALADHAVTSDKLADGSVSEAKLQANAVSTATIIDGAITTAKLDSHAVTSDKLADGSVSEAKLQTDAVSSPTIRDGAITTAKLAAGAVTEDILADGAISSAKIQDGAVETAAIAIGAVTTDQIADAAVTEAEIADGAVTNAKLALDFLTIGGVDYHLGDTVDVMTNPMTESGDLIVGGVNGEPTRLPANGGGTLQVVASKNGITTLVPLVLDQAEDVTIDTPTDGQLLSYDAATQQWTNTALPATGVTAGAYGNATQVPTITVDAQGRITAASNLTLTPAWTSITGKPATFPPSVHTHTLAGDVTGDLLSTVVGKLLGKPLGASAGAVSNASPPTLVLWWDINNQVWTPFRLWNAAAVTGWVNCYDSTAGAANATSTGVMAGTANSVFGRASATDGLPAALVAAEATVLTRDVGGVLGFSAVLSLGKPNASVGRITVNASANATPSTWTISGQTNALAATYNGVTVLEAKGGSTQQIVLKNTGGTLGTVVQIDWSGGIPRIQLFRTDISTTVPLVDLNLGVAPAGGWTTAKALSLREIDVCDNGTAKKMLLLASAAY